MTLPVQTGPRSADSPGVHHDAVGSGSVNRTTTVATCAAACGAGEPWATEEVAEVIELRSHRVARLAARRAAASGAAPHTDVTERLVSRARALRRQADLLPELAAVALRRRASELELEAFVVEAAASDDVQISR